MEDIRKKRQRGENWNYDEKEILRELISHSKHILENKSTKTNTNIAKAKEWLNVTNKLNKLTGKNRKVGEIRLAWKRMKLTAKANLSLIHRKQGITGGGPNHPSHSSENLQILIAPLDFAIDDNYYDSDIASQTPDNVPDVDVVIVKEETDDTEEKPVSNSSYDTENTTNHTEEETKANPKINGTDQQEDMINCNIIYKRRQIEMLEAEHALNITIAELKIKKLKLEISLLEKKLKNEN